MLHTWRLIVLRKMIKNNLERLSLDSCRETVETLMAFIRKGPAVAIGKRKLSLRKAEDTKNSKLHENVVSKSDLIPQIGEFYEKVAAKFNEIQLRWHCRLLFIVSI